MNTKKQKKGVSENQEDVQIGCNYVNRPKWQRLVAVMLIYIPIFISVPFMIFTAFVVRLHLVGIGGHNLKKYTDFLPNWASHRYTYDTQVTEARNPITRTVAKLTWIFNCKLYCPLTVALVKYLVYLIQVVEVWWCPFKHDKKDSYIDSSIDQSFWHIYPDKRKLLSDGDKENPMWSKNKDVKNI